MSEMLIPCLPESAPPDFTIVSHRINTFERDVRYKIKAQAEKRD